MKPMHQLLIALLVLGIAAGCTAMTDFDDPEKKLDVSDELSSEDIQVALTGDVGQVMMTFDNELPVDDRDAILAMIGEEIVIVVTSRETFVGVEITNQPVSDTPDAPGEYAVSIGSDNRTVTVTFYNEALGGQTVTSGTTYNVMVNVAENDYVETGVYSFEVTVD
ncbi:MAG: hypothetical protein JXX29_14340 [Deltaproteobacteria bacterium]|nr:hypothetical protein [Deltaproteobacteria bacterium]MBN2672858.1 hypothetical protein [Deltaproteobacteria bacterium]